MHMEEKDVKLRILLAAKELFAEQGYDGTTIRQICQKANANISLISYYFGGKEKVLQCIFETFFSGTKVNQIDDMFDDPLEALQYIVGEIISSFEDIQLSSIIGQELLMNSSRSEIVLSYVEPVWIKLEEILQKGKEKGLFHFDSLTDTSLIIRAICLSYKNNYKQKKGSISDSEETFEKSKQAAVQFILNGLKVSAP